MIVTRFCPTIESGLLHIGHLFNLWFNIFYALRHGGKNYFLLDGIQSLRAMGNELALYDRQPPGKNHRWQDFLDNKHTIGLSECHRRCNLHFLHDMFYTKIVCTPTLYDAFIWDKLIPEIKDCYKLLCKQPLYAMPLADFYLKTNVIIRGRDLQHPEEEWAETLFDVIWLRDIIFDNIANWEIKRYYHPLLLDENGDKMGKAEDVKHPSIMALMPRIFECNSCPAHVFLLFVASTLESRVVSHEELLNYYKTFDIEKVCEMDDFIYNDEMMQEIIERVAKDQPPDGDSIWWEELLNAYHTSDYL